MQPQAHTTPTHTNLRVTSTAFGPNGAIPIEYTQDGADTPPPLAWSEVPSGTKSVAILVEDPDAPRRTFVHWIVANIPPDVTELPGGDWLPPGAVEGMNDYGEESWRGPNPPAGRHRYVFRVFALDLAPRKPGITKPELMSAIKGHILAQGELVGTYDKSGHTHERPSVRHH